MLSKEECRSLVKTIREHLTWDLIDEAEKRIDDPNEFEAFFRKYNSKIVCDIVFEEPNPLLIGINDKWIEVLNEWSFKNGSCL